MRTPTVREIKYEGYVITVEYDESAESPRNGWTLGTIAANHKRYNLADDDGFEPTSTMSFYKRLAVRAGLDIGYVQDVKNWLYSRYGGYENYERAIDIANEYFERRIQKVVDETFLVIPVYMYEHGGVALSTGHANPFHSPWDSGQVGWIYVSRNKIADNYGDLSDDSIERAKQTLTREIETYSSYLNGDVYGYSITNPDGLPTGYGCWGFFDLERCIEEAKREVDNDLERDPKTR